MTRELKRFTVDETNRPVGFADTSGINRAGRLYKESLLAGVPAAQEVFDYAEKSLTVQRTTEAEADAAVSEFQVNPQTGMPEMPAMPSRFTVYGATYQEQMVRRYSHKIQSDIQNHLTQTASSMPYDPASFQEYAGEYLKETVKKVDPRARAAVEMHGRDVYRRLLTGIVDKKAVQDRAGAGLDEVETAENFRKNAMAAAGTPGWEKSLAAYKAQLENSPITWSTPGHVRRELNKFKKTAGLSASLRGIAGIFDDPNRRDELDVNDPGPEATGTVRRSEAIAALPQRKGELYTKFLKDLDLTDADLVEIQGVLNSQNTKIDSAETDIREAIRDMSATSVFHYFGKLYDDVDLEEIGVTPELIESQPTIATARMLAAVRSITQRRNASRVQGLREQQETDTQALTELTLTLARGQAADWPETMRNDLNAQITALEGKNVSASALGRGVNKIFTSLSQRATALKTMTREEMPFTQALSSFSAGGRGQRLSQTTKHAAIAERHFRRTLSATGWANESYENNDVQRAAYFYIQATGVVPEGFGQYISSLAGSDKGTEIGKAAELFNKMKDRTGVHIGSLSKSLGASGAQIVSALEQFEAAGGLREGGLDSDRALAAYRKVFDGNPVQFEKDWRDASGKESKSDQDAELSRLYQAAMGRQTGPSFWDRFVPVGFRLPKGVEANLQDPADRRKYMKTFLQGKAPQAGAQFRREVLDAFFAGAPSLRDGKYDNAMDRAVEGVLSSGNYGVSIAGGRPYGIEDLSKSLYIVKHAPEARLADRGGDATVGVQMLENAFNKAFQESPVYADMKDKPAELVFGHNLYVQWVRDDANGHPIYQGVMIAEGLDRVMAHRTTDNKIQEVLIHTGEIMKKVHEGYLSKVEAHKAELDAQRKELEDAKDKRGRN